MFVSYTPKQKKGFIGVAVISVIILIAVVLTILPASGRFSAAADQDLKFRIAKGQGLSDIAQALEDGGHLKYQLPFKIYAVISGQYRGLKAGLYELKPLMSISDLVHLFAGDSALPEDISVTVYEGVNMNELDAIFFNAGLTKRGEFLNPVDVSKEGFLFPGTYRFLPGTTHDQIIAKLEQEFTNQTGKLFASKALNSTQINRIITIASILEKEVRTEEDMRIVAGIIERRLSLGMPLQMDATVAYGVCREKYLIGETCSTSQVNLVANIPKEGEYNSYRNKGLPPGPISNPGLLAIEAAMNPQATEYLFYLNARSDGRTIYSKTGAEHERNRALYR